MSLESNGRVQLSLQPHEDPDLVHRRCALLGTAGRACRSEQGAAMPASLSEQGAALLAQSAVQSKEPRC